MGDIFIHILLIAVGLFIIWGFFHALKHDMLDVYLYSMLFGALASIWYQINNR